MIRGMYAGISGMKAQQTKLDNIGNNLANVSTTAFKSSRVVFKDMMYQNSSNAVGASNSLGGSNAKQIGLGVSVGSIDRVMGQGMMQPTGRPLDVAMDGDGFFMVAKGPVSHGGDGSITIKDGAIDAGNREIMYTRDGSFSLDSEGYLVTSNGERVLGYAMNGGMDKETGEVSFVDIDGEKVEAEGDKLVTLRIPDKVKVPKAKAEPEEEAVAVDGTELAKEDEYEYKKVVSYSIGKDGLITGVVEGGQVTVLGQLATASFKNPEGLEATGNNLYLNSANSGSPLISTGLGDKNPVTNGDIMQGMLEMSNVDIAEQFTDLIVTSRAFQASSKIISTSDEILQDVVNLKR